MLIQLHIDLGHTLTQVNHVFDASIGLIKYLKLFSHEIKSVVSFVKQVSLKEAKLLRCLV